MNFLFKYPTRGRPDWFRETLSTYYQRLSGKHSYQFVITMDADDTKMNTHPMRTFLNNQHHLVYDYTNSRSKVEAINYGVPTGWWDIVVLVSDDMVPLVNGFDDVIAKDMQRHFPDLSGILQYNDKYRPQEDVLMTWTVMGREFYERYGWLYYPAYKGTWCDNELTFKAYEWEKCAKCEAQIVRHFWHNFRGNAQYTDETYRRDDKLYREDEALFETRKAQGFPLSYSQSDEDSFIRAYFRNEFDGHFFDIGAGDGVTFSNTKLLVDMGWTGVAVEPSSNLCKAHREKVPKNVALEEVALMPQDGPTDFYHCPDFISTTNENHMKKWSHLAQYNKIQVPGISWETLCQKHGFKFDFINLDIEGENVEMFKRMPTQLKMRAKMMCIEYDQGLAFIQKDLSAFGFKTIHTNGENVIMAK